MDATAIKTRVRQYIRDTILLAGDQNIADDTSFLERSILDSTGVLELVAFLQETYGIKIDDEEMLPENLDSLNAVAAFVTRKGGKES